MTEGGSGINRSQPVPLQQRIRALRRRLLLERAFFLLVIVGLLSLLVMQEQVAKAYQISAGDQTIALVNSQSAANGALDEFKRKRVPDIFEKAFLYPTVRVVRVKREGRPLHSKGEVDVALSKAVKVFAPGAVIFANNRFVVGLRSRADAAKCIGELLKAYGPGKTAIKERVEIRETNLEASARLPLTDAVRVLQSPALARTHRVQPGDTARKIASAEGISVDTLKRLNPRANLAALKRGTVIKVSEARPRLTVITRREVTRIEPIAYDIQVVPMPSLAKGRRKVFHRGEPGEKRIVEDVTLMNGKEASRRSISVKRQKEPVTEVVWVGRSSR